MKFGLQKVMENTEKYQGKPEVCFKTVESPTFT